MGAILDAWSYSDVVLSEVEFRSQALELAKEQVSATAEYGED